MAEKTISSERIYEGKVINVRKDTVELENGKTATRDIVEHRGAVAIVPMIDDNHVLMVSQWRAPAEKELLEIPAGSINPGEDVETCAYRELIEETQYQAHRIQKLFSMYVAPGYSSEIIHVFMATELTPKHGIGDDDEFITVRTINIPDAIRMIFKGEIIDAKSIAGLLAVAQR